MKRVLLAVVAISCVVAPAAAGGGWATVQLSTVPTDGTDAGAKLPTDITVLQHGRTPLDGVTPVFRIRDGGGDVVASYRGAPTGRRGVYHVDVVFPREGTFTYEVYDGFETYGGARVHTYPAVRIGPDDGSFPYLPVGAGAALVLGAAAFATIAVRRVRPSPEAVAQ